MGEPVDTSHTTSGAPRRTTNLLTKNQLTKNRLTKNQLTKNQLPKNQLTTEDRTPIRTPGLTRPLVTVTTPKPTGVRPKSRELMIPKPTRLRRSPVYQDGPSSSSSSLS